MCTRMMWLLGFAAVLLVCASCSGTAPGRYPVRGKVTYNGQPATGASVQFRREGETAEETANFPIGVVDSDGNFELKAEGLGYGALPGKYKVLILWAEEPNREASATPTVPAWCAGSPVQMREVFSREVSSSLPSRFIRSMP